MDLAELSERARAVRTRYADLNAALGQHTWDATDYALGLMGDVGDLAKLVGAMENRRAIDDAPMKLAHELADVLWAVLVLADCYGVDLEQARPSSTTWKGWMPSSASA
jgi:NTP pyrophosphatase (non-canonical NTP hydrolase)